MNTKIIEFICIPCHVRFDHEECACGVQCPVCNKSTTTMTYKGFLKIPGNKPIQHKIVK